MHDPAPAQPPEQVPPIITLPNAQPPCPHVNPITSQLLLFPNGHRTAAENIQCLAFLCACKSANDVGAHSMDFSGGCKPICIDTGASASLSNSKEDLTSFHPVTNVTISGIGSGLTVTGVGTIRWLIVDDNGKELKLLIDNSTYVPQCPMNLFSRQKLLRQTCYEGDGFNALG
jgi:hypothetical protein